MAEKGDDNIERFRLMLQNISSEIEKQNVCLDILKFALFDLNRGNLERAENVSEIFWELENVGLIKPENVTVLIALFKLLWLDRLNYIISRCGFSIANVQPSDVFSPFRISIVTMSNRLQNSNINMIAEVFSVPQEECLNQWKLLQYLEDEGKLNKENLINFAENAGMNKETLQWHPAKNFVVPIKGVKMKYDFYIVSDNCDWEKEVLQGLKQIKPDITCLSKKNEVPGKLKTPKLIEKIGLCRKVVVGFSPQPATNTPEFVSATVVQKMLDEKTIDQGRLIPVKITKDAAVPDHLQSLTVVNFYDPDFYEKMIRTLDEEDISSTNIPSGSSGTISHDVQGGVIQCGSTQQISLVSGDQKKDMPTDIYQDVIAPLNLQDFYPGKLTCEQALAISHNISSDAALTNENIPWMMLQNLLMCNYHGRCLVSLKKPFSFELLAVANSSDIFTANEKSEQVSPADTLVALFLCSDNFLRQLIVEKLSMCQLAIPLILPIGATITHGPSYEMLIWALRTTRKQWINSKGTTIEKSVVEHPLPIVSFLRLGKSTVSKSRVLNSFVLGNVKHDMFFHCECKGGFVGRTICDGLVEIGWYLPGGKHDVLPHPLTILNLRGNASHLKKQTSFLSEISLVTIGFTSSQTFEEEDSALLESLYKENGHFILVLDDKPEKKLFESIKRFSGQYPPRKDRYTGVINCSNQNYLDISGQILTNISHLIVKYERLVPDKSIEKCAEIAEFWGFSVDEEAPDCLKAKTYVNKMMENFKQIDKKQNLPLQVIAVEIGNKVKEEFRQKHRGNKSAEKYKDEMQRDVHLLREKQKDFVCSPSVMFIKYQKSFTFPPLMRKYIHRFVKILIDSYRIDKLQSGHQEYFETWDELCEVQKKLDKGKKIIDNLKKFLCEAEKKHEGTDFGFKNEEIDDLKSNIHQVQQTEKNELFKLVSLKQNLDDLDHQLAGLSLGIEHFNREIGQVYEMTSYCELSDVALCQLPDVVAEMLLDGHPLELVDGDASYAPLSWIEAVFDSLRNLIGDKQIFILSVLDIQSSGRSTMLNVMFGLQCGLSDGRCAKGIFARLVKVDPNIQQETKYDYILVVDTEGLRLAELPSMYHNNINEHDSELATFVTGIGDVTIINIMGDNDNDIQDILQIVVHALMKMGIVNINPSCIFVHQNVANVTASEKNVTQKRKLTKMLDMITKCAAKEQKCSGKYQRFSDIIQFEENKDVMYISNLWQENTPMAPPNPGFSESVMKVKQKIIEFMKVSEHKGITGLKSQLSCVWNAILCENFVFSFRNGTEIIAHSALEAEYLKHSRTIRCKVLNYIDMLQKKCYNLSAKEIDSVGVGLLVGELAKIYEDMNALRKTMEDYFIENKGACQWKGRTKVKIDKLDKDIKKELKDAFKTVKTKIKTRFENVQIIECYKADVIRVSCHGI